MNNPQDQLERYQSFLNQDPQNINLICQVAQLQLQAGQIKEAGILLTNALENEPDDSGLQFNLSNILLAQGKYEDAIKILSQLDKLIGNCAIKYNLGYALLHNEKYEEALQELELVMREQDHPIDTSYWLGRCYYYLGDITNAEKYLSQHAELNPQNASSLGTLAMLSMDMENLEKAQELAESTLALDSNNTEALVTMGNIYLDQQDDQHAYDYFDRASTLHPESGRAWSGLGLAGMMKLDIKNAIVDLKKATLYMPSHLGTWHALAWAQIVINEIDEAKETLQNCMAIDRNFGETHGGLAVIDIIQGHRELAKEKIKRALKLDKMSFSANFAQSLLIQETNPEQSRKMIENIMSTPLSSGITLKDSLNKQLRKHNNIIH